MLFLITKVESWNFLTLSFNILVVRKEELKSRKCLFQYQCVDYS